MTHKEIEWHRFETPEEFECLRRHCVSRHLLSSALVFTLENVKLNVFFQHPSFIERLVEKFNVLQLKDLDIPEMYFVDRSCNPKSLERGYNHGYVSSCGKKAIVFSNEFGIFKSVINSFASYLMASSGYVPVHASITEVNGHGILFIGGHNAGKTTALVNFIDDSIRAGDSVRVLTDDWAIVQKDHDYVARTFDPSISLRFSDLQDNSNLVFADSQQLKRLFGKRTKISIHPNDLYGIDCFAESINIDTIVLLVDEARDQIITWEKDGASQIIVDAAYHYPYAESSLAALHVSFWDEVLSQVRFISFARGTQEDKIKNINLLRKEIL